jgi:lia operon protein LiaF
MNGRMAERWFWGLVIIGIGVIFLLRQMDVLAFDFNIGHLFATYWPVFLIVPGLRGLLIQRKYNFGQSLGSLVMVAIGTAFLTQNLGIYVIEWGKLFQYAAPVAIILVGLSFLFRGKRGEDRHRDYKDDEDYGSYGDYDGEKYRKPRKRHRYRDHLDHQVHQQHQDVKYDSTFDPNDDRYAKKDMKYQHYDPYEHVNTGTKTTLHKSGFIGDVYMGSDYWELQPLNISHFIGDTVIDLTKASIPFGETKIIVSSFIGDVKIFIPQDMDVEVKVTASSFIGDQKVLGRSESGLFSNMNLQTDAYFDAPRKLRIVVSMFIGDVIVQKVG